MMRTLPCWLRLAVLGSALCCLSPCVLGAQDRASTLSDAEVEKLRALAQDAPERVMAFVGFINQRADEMEKLTAGKRRPGREEDLHDLMAQVAGILDDLDDNLDEYSKHHNDVRKALPKLVSATERWGTVLKTPVDNQAYSVQRKLALESLNDVHEAAVQMIAEQATWFKDHPPSKVVPKREPVGKDPLDQFVACWSCACSRLSQSGLI